MADQTESPSKGKRSRWVSLLLGWGLAAAPAVLTVWLVVQVHHVKTGNPLAFSVAWSPCLAVDLAFRIDGLGLLFAFWELTSISSYLLIGFKHEQSIARAAAWQALLVTAVGGQALLAGFILLRFMGGTWSISALLEAGPLAGQHALYLPAMLLILAGAANKSAQFPFHFWLPNAMEAPTPVSAYPHSATMVKAGVYLLARLTPVLGETPAWEAAVVGLGGVTMLLTALLAWQESDLKLVLAYSTVTGLAMMIFLIGLGTEVAVKTAVIFLIVHSM